MATSSEISVDRTHFVHFLTEIWKSVAQIVGEMKEKLMLLDHNCNNSKTMANSLNNKTIAIKAGNKKEQHDVYCNEKVNRFDRQSTNNQPTE